MIKKYTTLMTDLISQGMTPAEALQIAANQMASDRGIGFFRAKEMINEEWL